MIDQARGEGAQVVVLLSHNGMDVDLKLASRVRGLDAIDGTPVVDIKPVMRGFAPRGEIREPDWAREIMSGYW